MRMAPAGSAPAPPGHDICFIHPRPNETFPIAGAGVLIELVQAPAEHRRWQWQRFAIEERSGS